MTVYPFPLRLRLAADPRFGQTSLEDDHIWLLTTGQGDPAALSIETSYGHRAQQFRLYPEFRWRGRSRVDPAEFVEAISVEAMLSNYARLSFVPFVDLRVAMEYWVVDSQTLVGRISLTNLSNEVEEHQLRWHAQLRPSESGEPMALRDHLGVDVLQGKTDSLHPLVFLSGGAVAERVAVPALRIKNRLPAGGTTSLFWGTSAQANPAEAFKRLRALADARWQAEVARIELANSGLVHVETGDPAWDYAFSRAQQVALGLAVSGSTYLPAHSFVLQRTVDHGFSGHKSSAGDQEGWAGQDVHAAYQLAGQLLPSAPELIEGFLRNYLHGQGAHGQIDAKPGLAGQLAKFNAAPLLAGLAWRTYLRTGSENFLREVYPPLLEFLSSWFRKERDKDKDGAPEWESPLQTGPVESVNFTRWADWSQAIDIRTVEAPDLLAYLLHECQSLVQIARELGRTEDLPDLETRATSLRRNLERGWSEQQGLFLPVDRDLNVPLTGKQLAKGSGGYTKKIGKKFDPLVRLVVRCWGPETEAKGLAITVHGRGPGGQFRKERLDKKDFAWFWQFGSATTQHTFASIDRLEVSSPSKEFSTEVTIADHRRPEASWLLPLWGSLPAGEPREALIDWVLSDRFRSQYGICSAPQDDKAYGSSDHLSAWGIHIGQNKLLAEALLSLELRQEAADLVQRLMQAVIGQLAAEGSFREVYHPQELAAAGARDSAFGLAPLGLFLQTLGVGLETPWSLRTEGLNPFPWPVTLRWQGLTVHRPLDSAGWIEFPDGARVQIDSTEAQRIARDR